MKSRDMEQQIRLQALAEQAERQHLPASGDPRIDSYRLVMRALRQPPALQLPADFAASLAAKLNLSEEKTSLEDLLVTGVLLAMAVVGLVYVQPVMASIVGQFHLKLPTIPWPLLVAACVSVGLAWAIDRGALRLRNHG